MQLPVYLNAALEIERQKHPEKEVLPAGIFYYRIQDPIVKKEETKAEVEQSILKELKLDGLVNADENVVEHLERNLSGTSTFYPLRMNKNRTLSSASKALSKENFDTVLAYTKEKEKELKDVMYQGEVAALPYVLDEMTGCDYCGCRDICGFDQRIEGCEYRRLRKYTLEEALNSMKERLGILEEKGEAGE